jgi:hypothetical protein
MTSDPLIPSKIPFYLVPPIASVFRAHAFFYAVCSPLPYDYCLFKISAWPCLLFFISGLNIIILRNQYNMINKINKERRHSMNATPTSRVSYHGNIACRNSFQSNLIHLMCLETRCWSFFVFPITTLLLKAKY